VSRNGLNSLEYANKRHVSPITTVTLL
jgi:hypothetical protein